MSRYVLTPLAMADVDEIVQYIQADNPRAALRTVRKLRDAMRQLARTPGMGHLRQDLADEPLRFFPVYSCLIVYRPDTRPLEMIRVLHASRDLKSILKKP
jgi:antitoxin ParD1/3/4/toxin ParE1/3/4